jgi:hypothetical protein
VKDASLLPDGFAEGSPTLGAPPQGFPFGLCLGLTDIVQPLLSRPEQPIGERHRLALVDMATALSGAEMGSGRNTTWYVLRRWQTAGWGLRNGSRE